MTARTLYREALPFLLSERAAAHLLGIDRGGTAFKALIRSGRLRLVQCGTRQQIPLEDVQRIAREGFGVDDAPPLRRSNPRRVAGHGVGDRIRALDLEALAARRRTA